MTACPADYRLSFAASGVPQTQTLYVVGGLYGNLQALQALWRLIEPEATVVFNGDIHWFDAELSRFEAIEAGLKNAFALNGNVEAELAREHSVGAGCGCFYPSCVSDQTKLRANEIHERLSGIITPELKTRLNSRAKTLLVPVGAHTVAITHGDEKSLAGWECGSDVLTQPDRQAELEDWFQTNGVSVLATSHTCEAALLALPGGVVINNGAAGLPNFKSPASGVVTRISTRPAQNALYGAQLDGLYVDAIDLNYDHAAFIADFCALWDSNSPAYRSYFERIANGVKRSPSQAVIRRL